jgi:predicted alpha/beta hydrolase family esterase
MKQVIVIHGGTTFSSNEKYIDSLRTKTITLERMIYSPSWKETLQQKLGDNYQVILPRMPNGTNARYDEWKLWFSRIVEIIDDECILVGHSLGAVFLAKYLSEIRYPKRIIATILVAAPFDDETDEDLADFKLNAISSLFHQQAGKVIFYNGTDDPVIQLSEADKFKREIPDAQYHLLPAPDHFVRAEFQELITSIQGL